MNRKERLEWLQLARSERVGPQIFRRLVAHFGSPKRAMENLPDIIGRIRGARGLKLIPWERAKEELERVEEMGGKILTPIDPQYPRALAVLDDAPPILSVLGHGSLLLREAMAVVGLRNASAAGLRTARKMAADLAQRRFVIVSGLARGIDTAAHEAALDEGTVAVMAGGVDVVYPMQNKGLYDSIRECGAIVSEQPWGRGPARQLFPQRNRIISGLSIATVVVEAGKGSGALITARFAAEQGRDVFAVPGSPSDPRSYGTNMLIRDGATLIQSASDVISSLSRQRPYLLGDDKTVREEGPSNFLLESDEKEMDGMRSKILQLLSPTPVHRDELARLSGINSQGISYFLTELEIAGLLVRYPGDMLALDLE